MDPSIIESYIQQKSLKPYIPFLKLARDSLAANPIISYWSLYYILDLGIKNKEQNDELRRFLAAIMTCLEKEKSIRKGDPLFDNEEEAKKFIENYGNQLLVRAENDAELGVSPGVATKLYIAASNVYQLMVLFGETSEENAKRIKYCKWKAVNIFKEAKNQAQQPQTPPPPTSNTNPSDFAEQNQDLLNLNFDANVSAPKESSLPSSNDTLQPLVPASKPEEPDINFAGLTLNDSDLKKAELLCESALYAIRSNDILTAVTSLKQTLSTLQKSARK